MRGGKMRALITNPVWQLVVEGLLQPEKFEAAQRDFLKLSTNRVPVLKEALLTPGHPRHAALHLFRKLTLDEQKQLFPELIQAARSAHGPIGAVRDLIGALPRDWVLAHIDALVEPILRSEEYDDYWMFLELYEQLDPERAMKLARRAIAQSDPDIRDVGELASERLTATSNA
jgi:hypothetical protein